MGPQPTPTPAGWVLWAEDSVDDQRLIAAALQGVRGAPPVQFAKDGPGLLAALEEGRPALVVVDLHMPGMHGIDAIGRIRARTERQDVPVIVFTSSTDLDELAACARLGAQAVVHKPVEHAAFQRAVARIVRAHCTDALVA